MAYEVVMPKMGESIVEGTILDWKKKVGDFISKDEIFNELKGKAYSLKSIKKIINEIDKAALQKEFVFKVIEPSKIEEIHSSPKKVIILLGFMFLGFILGSLVSIFLHKGNK